MTKKKFCGDCMQMKKPSEMWSDFTCKTCAKELDLGSWQVTEPMKEIKIGEHFKITYKGKEVLTTRFLWTEKGQLFLLPLSYREKKYLERQI